MACCTRYCSAEAQFDRKVAERDLKRYRRRGADHVTKLLLAELRNCPLQDKELLDIGAGIGVVSAELASHGIASATIVDASPFYIEVARREIASRYAPRPTQFVAGDFVFLASTLWDADIVTLDRVVCCYPDAQGLLRAAAQKTRQLIAFSYPRDCWYMRATVAMQNLFRQLNGNSFRVLVHSPRKISAALEQSGLCHISRCQTIAWVVDLYERIRPIDQARES